VTIKPVIEIHSDENVTRMPLRENTLYVVHSQDGRLQLEWESFLETLKEAGAEKGCATISLPNSSELSTIPLEQLETLVAEMKAKK
jgi:hypothetical protein